MFGLKPALYYLPGMSHEPKSPSLGMISTATRTTATVSPLNPSSLNGSIVPNGSPAANSTLSVPSAHSASFAAALRKLAKQAEEPRGSSISSESSPVSSPATNHSSPASTPKRGPIGPILVPPAGHSVPSTPPVVTIAPTKTVNGLWRSESRQPEPVARGPSRERMHTESQHQSEKGTPSITSHLLGTPYACTHGTVVQDSRFPPLNLQRPIPHVVTPGDMQEEYFRSFRPYHTGEELRMPTLPPMGLEAAATAYYHSSYFAHHPFPHPAFRVDDSYCLSALRSPFYPIATPASLPPLHPSAMHLHLPGMRFPAEFSHPSLSALQSERLSERLQMDEEIRREREREREREKEREAEREKEREREQEREKELEREKEKEREREREREMERDRERNREKEMNTAKAMENHYLHVPELHSLRGQQIDDRVKAAERLTPNRTDKAKDFALTCPKAVHPNLHQSPVSHHAVPTLIPNHNSFIPPGSSSAMLLQRNNEEEKWMAKQRQLRQEKEDRQYQVSEFRQQVLEQHLDIGRPGSHNEVEHRDSVSRSGHSHHELCSRDQPQQLGAPPPLISPKPQHKEHHSSPAVLWNPVSLMDNHTEVRKSHDHHVLNNYASHYDSHRQPGPLIKMEKIHGHEESVKRRDGLEKYQPQRGPGSLEHATHTHSYGPPFAELEKSAQTILNQQRMSVPFPGHYSDMSLLHKSASAYRQPHGPPRAPGPMYVYDELLQRHRRLISKLDLEEKKRKEAKEKGYYYDFDDSYDESDEEEVRAHLWRVAEQPPLKLDDSSEKLDFLRVFSLTTQAQREELLKQKQRKRRRMLMERSPSPPRVPNKRQAPSPRPLHTSKYSADEMNSTPDLAEKKRFLTSFSLAHILPEKRKEKETLMEMIHSLKQKPRPSEATFKYLSPPSCSSPSSSQTVTAAELPNAHSVADSDRPPSATPVVPAPPELRKSAEPVRAELPKASETTARPKEPGLHSDKSRPLEGPVGSRTVSVLTNAAGALQKENPASMHSLSEKSKPWEVFMAEDFAQQFHESVLQSTQRALQKHKGTTATLTAEQNHKLDASVRYNIPEMHSVSGTLFTHQNGQHAATQTRKGMACEREEESDNEDDEEEEDPRPFQSKWQGIEAVFEAYQEYVEEQNVERQVLQAQCRRLENFHYNLSLTAEQLSLSMSELLAQKQKLASERERLHSELDHLRKCLALPTMHWSRSYFKSYPR
ncbi:genetic suppressor element 1 isoform X3 [Mustelus asterias]